MDNRFLLSQPMITKQRWSICGISGPLNNPFSKGHIHIFKIRLRYVLFLTKHLKFKCYWDRSRNGNLQNFCCPDSWSKASFMCLSSAAKYAQKIRELVRQKGALKTSWFNQYQWYLNQAGEPEKCLGSFMPRRS